MLALEHLGTFSAIVFIVGLTAATFSSADSVLTTLTTSFCIDFLGAERSEDGNSGVNLQLRHAVHIGFAVILLLVILVFKATSNRAVIDLVLGLAGYTYGPLLGLYAFGLCFRSRVNDKFVPLICLLPPIVCYVLSSNSEAWLNGYKFGFELLIANGLLTMIGLWLIRVPGSSSAVD